ncbi:DoxX family protein [Pseudoalteromonas spongiae]|uniref:DoxX family protein n=1 Tax=Pseudoalteromonas spongiae TaxID=298657 RepID=UPI0037360CFD
MITPILILILLTSPLLFGFIKGQVTRQVINIKQYASIGLGITFVFFAIGHIVKTHGMVEMLPPWVPLRLQLVYATGVLEFAVGIALFTTKYRELAAKLAIVIFIVFFPANIYAALNSIGLGGHQWGPIYLLIRAPLQIILIAWAYFLCVKTHRPALIATTENNQ